MALFNKVFICALFISAALHGIIFLQSFGMSLNLLNKKEHKVEVSYLKGAELNKYPKQPNLAAFREKQEFLKLPSRVTVNNRMKPRYGSGPQRVAFKADFNKPAFTKPTLLAAKKKISMPAVSGDKINSPSYISYYQIVREKIRRAAYQNYSRTETGEAYVTFIIASDGSLKAAQVIEEKSSLNAYLRDTALKSVRQATPFPGFPKELNYPQLSFNVIISFEIE